MKIALITHGRVNPDGNNGVARTVYNLNLFLNQAGIETEILAFDDRQKQPEIYRRDEHTTIHLFPRAHYFRGTEMADYIRKNKFDLLHFHLMWMLDKNELLRSLHNTVPYVITAHGAYSANLTTSFKKRLSLHSLEGNFLKQAAMIHALCHEEKCHLREQQHCRRPICVIPNGINDDERILIRQARSHTADPYDHSYLNVAMIARLRPDKNVLGMIHMLDYLPADIRQKLRLNLVGDGVEPYWSQVKSLAAQPQYRSNVILHGPKYGEEKYAYISNADIYLQPSFSEGISFSILDAMACGAAMILSRQTNMTHYYNENFYLMTETYPEDIASAVTQLARSPEYRKQLGEKAEAMTREAFAWKKLVSLYIKMYQDALEQSKK